MREHHRARLLQVHPDPESRQSHRTEYSGFVPRMLLTAVEVSESLERVEYKDIPGSVPYSSHIHL